MASTPIYTAEELAEMERLRAEIAAQRAQAEVKDLPSESEEARKRLLVAAKNAGIRIVSEATGAAVGQKAALPLAAYTFGMSVPIGGAIGGLAGYEAAMRATGEEPTMLGRLQAAGMGAIPFAPEARLATGTAGAMARVTGQEMAESAARMGAATGAAAIAPKIATGEKLEATDVLPFIGGAGAGAAARFAGAATASGEIAGREARGAIPAAAGPSAEAASAKIQQARFVDRDSQLRNWLAVGGVLDPKQFNPNIVTRTVERAVGESEVALEQLRKINMAKVGDVIRNEIGLGAADQLTIDVLAARRKELGQVYEAVRSISPSAEKALDKLQDARDFMRKSWRAWKSAKDQNKGTSPDLLETAQDATQTVNMLEDRLATIVKRSGNTPLYNDLVAARPQLAKIWVADSALDKGPNLVDPSVLGQIHNATDNLLTDGMRMIAEVYNTQRQAFQTTGVREAARERRLPLGGLGATAGAYYGGQMGGAPGAVAGAIAGGVAGQTMTDVASSNLRRLMLPFMTGSATTPGLAWLSQRYQNVYGIPQYGTNVATPLSLFLAKTGGPSGVELQQFLAQQQAAQSP